MNLQTSERALRLMHIYRGLEQQAFRALDDNDLARVSHKLACLNCVRVATWPGEMWLTLGELVDRWYALRKFEAKL